MFSLGFFGLVALPALGLAAFGGRPWPRAGRWSALAAMGSAGLLWFGLVSPACAAGPYAALPDRAHRVWLDLITETAGLLDFAATRPLQAAGLSLGIVAALGYLTWRTWSGRTTTWISWWAALLTILLLATWQIRMLPLGQALAAPVLGVLVVQIRDRVPWELVRPIIAIGTVLVASGFLLGFLGATTNSDSTPTNAAIEPCLTRSTLDELGALEPGLVVVEMDLGPEILLGTEHRILASPYHRMYEGVLAAYDLYAADPEEAQAQAQAAGVTYVLVCDQSPLSNVWVADNPEGLLAVLLEDEPPAWLEKVIDTGRSRVYSVR